MSRFRNRQSMWAERRNLSKKTNFNDESGHVKTVTNCTDDIANRLCVDEDINPEPHILKVEETRNDYLNSLKQCPHCGNDNKHLIYDKNLDGDMWIKYCQNCKEIFGVDDTSSVYDVKETIKSWKLQLCTCGNNNAYLYDFIRQEGEEMYLLCKCCNKEVKIGAETKVADQTESHVNPEVPPVLACKCGNNNISFLHCYQEEGSDQIIGMKCSLCSHSWLFENSEDFDGLESNVRVNNKRKVPDTEDIKQSCPLGREEVDDAWGVNEVDHLAWWRPEGYWHHALVEHVYPETNEVEVIHYNGPSPTGHFIKGKVVKEKLDLGKEKGLLYRLKYNGPCYERDATIIRAESRLGEVKYNLFTNNCEHFVRWCKTGVECCIQVKSLCETLSRIGGKVTTCFSKEVVKKGIGFFAANSMSSAGRAAAGEAVSTITNSSLLAVSGTVLCECIGVGTIVAIEGITAGRDIYKAYNLKKEGHISKQEFLNITVRRSSQGIGGASLGIGGGIVGQALIPVPILGAMIGCTLGALLGHALGHGMGYIYASNQRKK